jgi:hypothetical protein
MPDDPVPRCYLVCVGRFLAREAAGASGHRGIPRALCDLEGETFLQKPGRLAPRGVYSRLERPIVMPGPSPRRRGFGPAGGTSGRRRAEPFIGAALRADPLALWPGHDENEMKPRRRMPPLPRDLSQRSSDRIA